MSNEPPPSGPAGRLIASEADLLTLNQIATGAEVDDAARTRLLQTELLQPDGRVTDEMAALAHTAAAPVGTISLHTYRGGSGTQTTVRWSDRATLVAPNANDPTKARNVALRPAVSLVHTLLELLDWQPIEPTTTPLTTTLADIQQLTTTADVTATRLGQSLNATSATVHRIEIASGPGTGSSLVMIDLGDQGWMQVTQNDGATNIAPLDGTQLVGHLTAVQAGFVHRGHTPPTGSTSPATPHDRAVDHRVLGDIGVEFDVPRSWEVLEVGTPKEPRKSDGIDGPDPTDGARVVFIARQPESPWFRVNLTITTDPEPPIDDPIDAALVTATSLQDPIILRASRHPQGGSWAVILHRTDTLGVIVTQRTFEVGSGAVTASWTWAVEQEPQWRSAADTLINSFTTTPAAST